MSSKPNDGVVLGDDNTSFGDPRAPVVELETAVSHVCMPIEPFRCWQYDARAKAIPLWVLEYLTIQGDGRVEFNAPDNGPSCILEGGDWVVLFDAEEQLVAVYTIGDFADLFRCVFQ